MAKDNIYLTELIKRAHELRLAESPEWHALLHYKSRFLAKGVKSQVGGELFFAASDGKHDPEAELNATIAGFFENNGTDAENSAQCKYVARYHWLNQALEFDPGRLPPFQCRSFQHWFEEMNPQNLTLIFPSAYLNNPASMFGHTLLRVDARGQDAQTRLLAYTINYAASTDRQRGVQYAFKGLFGMYRGKFSIAPYYLEVKEYGDIENRDIWEFGLNLTKAEIDQLLRHAWELRSAYFDYYFLDENCSYQLLSLLEAARPGLRLTDRFVVWAIPSETVRAVMEAGLITEVHFRSARTTLLQERARLLDNHLQMLAKSLAVGELKSDGDVIQHLDPVEQAKVIELALDYTSYRQYPGIGRTTQSAGTVSELLKARSLVDAPDQTPVIPAPEFRPGGGHRPSRAGIGFGIEDQRQFLEFKISPGYHDLFDPEGGFTHGAQVKFLDTAFRYYPEKEEVELERIDIIDIMSLSSWSRFLRPLSWKVDLGVGRKRFDAWNRPVMGRLNGGIGISHDFSKETTAYAFAGGTLELSDRFDFIIAPGIGPGIGIVHDLSEHWRTGLFFLEQLFFLHEWRNDYDAAFRNLFSVNRQNVIGLDLSRKREFRNNFAEGTLYWQIYF